MEDLSILNLHYFYKQKGNLCLDYSFAALLIAMTSNSFLPAAVWKNRSSGFDTVTEIKAIISDWVKHSKSRRDKEERQPAVLDDGMEIHEDGDNSFKCI